MSKVYKAQNIFYHNFMDFSIKNKPTRHYPTGLSAHPYSIYFSTEYSGRFWFFRNIHSTSKFDRGLTPDFCGPRHRDFPIVLKLFYHLIK